MMVVRVHGRQLGGMCVDILAVESEGMVGLHTEGRHPPVRSVARWDDRDRQKM